VKLIVDWLIRVVKILVADEVKAESKTDESQLLVSKRNEIVEGMKADEIWLVES